MTVTTTAVNACNAKVYLDNALGNLTEITGSSLEITPALKSETGEYKVFAYEWLKRLQCGRDWSFKLNVVYSTAAAEGWALLRDWWFGTRGNRSIRVEMPDGTAGSDRFDGEVVLETLDWTQSANDPKPTTVTAVLLANGELVHNIIGS